MKINEAEQKGGRCASRIIAAASAVTLLAGCTHTARHMEKVSAELREESKALTTAVVDTLEQQPTERRDVYSATALEFAKQDQRIEGLPVKPFDVRALLPIETPRDYDAFGSTNNFQGGDKKGAMPALSSMLERAGSILSRGTPPGAETRPTAVGRTPGVEIHPTIQTPGAGTGPTKGRSAASTVGRVSAPGDARMEIAKRFARENKLIAQERKAESKLVQLGAVKETEDNARKVFWAKWISAITLPIGGMIALCVFFPVAIPFVGRFLGWIVAKIPGLAGWIGVVSTKAFDAIVKGIENTKRSHAEEGAAAHEAGGPSKSLGNQFSVAAPTVLRSPTDLTNEDSRRRSAAGFMSALELNLSRCMDEAHKRLVRVRRKAAAQ
jgi:outer membrane murein-binding lipoprotein Lpp